MIQMAQNLLISLYQKENNQNKKESLQYNVSTKDRVYFIKMRASINIIV